MSGSSHGTGTSNTQPWGPQQPYLKEIFKTARQNYNTPMQYYPGQTIAGFTPYQQQAQNAVAARAMGGSDLLRNAQAQTLATARGDFLDPSKNPWLTSTYNAAYDRIRPSMNAAAVQAGRYGSSAWSNADATTQAQLANQIYGGNYQTERDRMAQAIAASPQMANADYADMSKLAAVGEEQQAMNQAQINEDMKRYNFNQMEPTQRLGILDQFIEGNYGGQVVGRNAGGK